MPNPINVSSMSHLYDVLANATGGETILLEGGDYGGMFLSMRSGFDLTFPSNVTIASADPDNPAVFSSLDIRGATNLTFDGITFDYEFQAGDPIYLRPFSVTGSSNITIRNSTFDGDVATGVSETADGYGYGIGLSFRHSTGVTVENNEIFGFHRGSVIGESADVIVRGNDIHTLRMDGMNFSEISGALIEDNYIHDFHGSPNSNDHCDMIQFWTNGTNAPSSDIIIRNNYLDIGEGTATQSIFMRNDMVDRGLAGPEMFYRDIVIENNVIVNGHLHGISVGETDGLIIRDNSVLHADGLNPGTGAQVEIPRINIAETSIDVQVESNITSHITGENGQPDWRVINNAFVQDTDPNAPGYYGDVFLSTSLHPIDGVHSFQALPGGLLYNPPVGAAATRSALDVSDLTAQFQVSHTENDASLRHFDASFSTEGQGDLPEGTMFHWDFGDGNSATGVQVSHAFASGGIYTVALTVELPNGQSQSRDIAVGVSGSGLLSYTAQEGLITYAYGVESLQELEGAVSSDGIKTEGQGIVTARIDRKYVDAILGQDEFSLSMTLASDTPASAGEVIRLHQSFIVAVTPEGELNLRTFGNEGEQIRLTTSGATLNDMAPHAINISLNDGLLAISVDGNTLASAAMTEPLANLGRHDLTFGNPWNGINFDGLVTGLEVTVNASDYAEPPFSRSEAMPLFDILQPEDLPEELIEAMTTGALPETPAIDTAAWETDADTSAPDPFETLLITPQDGYFS